MPSRAMSASARRLIPREISNYLRHAGYTEAGEQGKSKFGVYKVMKDAIEIKPGEESYYNAEGAVDPRQRWPR